MLSSPSVVTLGCFAGMEPWLHGGKPKLIIIPKGVPAIKTYDNARQGIASSLVCSLAGTFNC